MASKKEFLRDINIRKIGVHALIALTLFLFISWLALSWLDTYTKHAQAVVVPNVQNMTIQEASMMLRNKGLKSVVIDSTYVKAKSPGTVMEQNPAGGQKVKEGRMIYLTINSQTVPTTLVPDVADNSSARQARMKLQAAGFKLTADELISGEKEWVYSIKYKGNELLGRQKVPVGATLTLVVGNGASIQSAESATDSSSTTEPIQRGDSWF